MGGIRWEKLLIFFSIFVKFIYSDHSLCHRPIRRHRGRYLFFLISKFREALQVQQPTPMDQQQTPAGSVPNPPQKTSAAATSFGNIVPFIVVISLVAVISIVSCVVGRIYSRRAVLSTPLQTGANINLRPGNWVERIKKRFKRGKAGDVGVGQGSGDHQAGTNDGNAPVAVAGGNDQQPPPGPPPPA